jgi:hypothetical protein
MCLSMRYRPRSTVDSSLYVCFMGGMAEEESGKGKGKGAIEWPTEPNREIINAL